MEWQTNVCDVKISILKDRKKKKIVMWCPCILPSLTIPAFVAFGGCTRCDKLYSRCYVLYWLPSLASYIAEIQHSHTNLHTQVDGQEKKHNKLLIWKSLLCSSHIFFYCYFWYFRWNRIVLEKIKAGSGEGQGV